MRKLLFVANVAKEHVLKFHIPTIAALTAHGWIVDVACGGAGEIRGCRKWFRMPWGRSPFSWRVIAGIRQLKGILKQENYDVIYCHTAVGGIAGRLAAIAARKRGVRVVYFAHGFHFYAGAPLWKWMVYYPAERILARWTDVLFTLNREDYAFANRHFPGRIDVRQIPGMGVDFSRLDPVDPAGARRSVREELDIPEDAALILYVAELIANKNQFLLIDALKILRERGRDVCLLLAGPDHAEGNIQRYARRRGVSAHCRFPGWRSDVGALMAASDLYAASSLREGFPLNLIEAMYCGLTVVAADNRGHETIIRDGENGYLVQQGDALAMADRISSVLDGAQIDPVMLRREALFYDADRIAEVIVQELAQAVF